MNNDERKILLFSDCRAAAFYLFKVVLMIIALLIVTGSVVNKILPDGQEYKVTRMEAPSPDSGPGRFMDLLKSLDNPDILSASIEYGNTAETYSAFVNTRKSYLEREWRNSGGNEHGGEYRSFMEFTRKSEEEHDNDRVRTVTRTDMFLRSLVDKGYQERIHWPSIKYIGHTSVVPVELGKVHYDIFFESQGRLFNTTFTALEYEGTPVGVFMENNFLNRVKSDSDKSWLEIINAIINSK